MGLLASPGSKLLKRIRNLQHQLPELTGVKVVALASLSMIGLVLGLRHLGSLQPMELAAYDQMLRLRPDGGRDSRLLIVAITEKDIRQQKRWPMTDRALAEVLRQLQQHQPAAIGVDLYRNLPIEPGHSELLTELQKPNVIGIRSIDEIAGSPAPPQMPAKQIGFNDLVLDPDGVVRRNLLYAGETRPLLRSLSLRLSLLYLKQQGIEPGPSPINSQYMQLGQASYIPLHAQFGGYALEAKEAQGYQVLLNYRSPQKIARTVPISRILEGKFRPEWVKGKIVLIGTTAPSLKDVFLTPYSPALREGFKMPGVAIHAQSVSQILDAASGERPLFGHWPEEMELLWIAVWTGFGGFLGWSLRHPGILACGVTIALSTLFGSTVYCFLQSLWIPAIAPLGGFILTAAIVITYRSYQAQQQQQIVMKLLGQNTSPEIAKALWRGRDFLLKSGKLPGMRLTATMMFADIKDFSTISEQMPPEALLEWLNELLDVVAHEVVSREGIINKFTGDGFMAVFGVPMSRTHPIEEAKDAQQTVECALVLRDRLKVLNKAWKIRGLPTIQMRIGIYTGPVVVGSLGGKERLEYGVLGDSVNTAARLESCEKDRQVDDCRILIGYETLSYLENLFTVERWGPLALKGKEQLVDVYRVTGRNHSSHLTSPLPGQEANI